MKYRVMLTTLFEEVQSRKLPTVTSSSRMQTEMIIPSVWSGALATVSRIIDSLGVRAHTALTSSTSQAPHRRTLHRW